MIQLQQEAKGERPRYFDDPAIDTVLSIALALAGEVAVLRDHLDTAERLTEIGVKPTRDSIEAFAPDADVRADRDQWRDVVSMSFCERFTSSAKRSNEAKRAMTTRCALSRPRARTRATV